MCARDARPLHVCQAGSVLPCPPPPACSSVKPPPPDIGVLRIPRHDFAQDFSDFSFQSHLTKLEVITAIQKILNENQRVLKVLVPCTRYPRALVAAVVLRFAPW